MRVAAAGRYVHGKWTRWKRKLSYSQARAAKTKLDGVLIRQIARRTQEAKALAQYVLQELKKRIVNSNIEKKFMSIQERVLTRIDILCWNIVKGKWGTREWIEFRLDCIGYGFPITREEFFNISPRTPLSMLCVRGPWSRESDQTFTTTHFCIRTVRVRDADIHRYNIRQVPLVDVTL
jgi:hypothetical protein